MKILLKDIKSVRWAIMIIIAYFALFRKFIYTICPVVLMTGYPCPGCGLTRAALRLLHFDFTGAWEMHPFIYVIGVLALFFCLNRYILNGKYTKQLKAFVVITAIAMIIFYIWRMFTIYPEIPPMTYYEGNCLRRILYFVKYLGIA